MPQILLPQHNVVTFVHSSFSIPLHFHFLSCSMLCNNYQDKEKKRMTHRRHRSCSSCPPLYRTPSAANYNRLLVHIDVDVVLIADAVISPHLISQLTSSQPFRAYVLLHPRVREPQGTSPVDRQFPSERRNTLRSNDVHTT